MRTMATWITSFVLLLRFISQAESCESIKLPRGDVLGCVSKGKQVPFDAARNTTIPADTVCIVDTDSGVIHAQCTGSDLEITKGTEETKRHVRRKRGFWRGVGDFFKGVADGILCVVTLFSCLWSGRAGPRDRTPPSMICKPAVIYKTTEPYALYAYATWNEPTAYDDTDGSITPRRKSGRPPGSYFPENDTKITYEVKDESGNRAECSITVKVKIVRCATPKKVENGYFQCNPVTDFLYGCTCRFGCYEGFDLQGGPSVLECQKNGKWSGPQPACKPWKCPVLGTVDGAGLPVCTDEFNFRSVCSYNCGTGFDMPPKVSSALVCSKGKKWRKKGEPKCIDVEPPSFTQCPSSKIFGTDVGLNSTSVNWQLPKVKDNSEKAEAYLKRGKPRGTRFSAGTYTMQYGARDDAGNKAINDCTFILIVRQIRCPKLYPAPFVQIDCPDGYRSGVECNITCDPGKILNGSDNVECIQSPDGFFGYWNWKGGQQTICKHGRKCVTITPPRNGAVVCDNWEGGQYCQIQCKRGTELSSVSLKRLYVCSTDGDWSAHPPTIKTCKAVRRRNVRHTFGVAASYYYFDGDCRDPITQMQIANNFISVMNASIVQPEACPDSAECNPQNVQIDCGEADRKKRSTTYENETKPVTILKLTMTFPINVSSESMYTDARYEALIGSLRSILIANEYDIFGNTSVGLKKIKSKGLQIYCPEGAVKSEQTWNCVDCPEGSYYTKKSSPAECVACRKGSYQDEVAQMKCIRCPAKTTTQTVGAKSYAECKDACPPGSSSQDGLLPCSPCEQGEYQPSYGQTFCRTCKGSRSTQTFGSASSSECEEFDIDVIAEETSDVEVTLPKSVKVKDFTLTFWYQRYSTNTSNTALSVKFFYKEEHVLWSWDNLKTMKRQNTMETDIHMKIPDSRWHHITLYSGSTCNIAMTLDGMPFPVNTHTGSCTQMVMNKLSISADKGAGGSFSKFNMWQGKRNTDYRQRCFSNNVGDILSWKTFEEANITGAYMRFPSQCDDFNNCVSSPCLHGMCTDALHGFTCTCNKGYVGTQCDVNIDDCDVNICINNATCVDGIAAYTCLCPPEYTGQYCEIKMVDGGWSEWGNWSECSTACGHGKITRKRLCNSPTPDNGGEYCVGEQNDFKDCNNSDCPVCPPIFAPSNGSLDCVNDTESINCTVSCDDGFDFDIEPLPLYYCGPETFQEWNYQTDKNPERRLPKCVAIQLPETLKVLYTAHYRDLYCSTAEIEEYTRDEIDLAVKSMLSSVPCLLQHTCNLSFVDVINCESKGRQARATKTAGFSLQITSSPTEDDKNETMNDLQTAFQFIQNAADNGELTIEILDDEFELNRNLTGVSGEVVCRPGETRVKFYCVPCGKGSYLYKDYCKPCPVGTYQHTDGQSVCINCPLGKSTVGVRSASIDDCTVDVQMAQEEFKVPWIGITAGFACVLVVTVIVLLVRRRYEFKHAGFAFTKAKMKDEREPDNSLKLYSIRPLNDLPAHTLNCDLLTDPYLPADTLNGDPVIDPDLTADTLDGDLVTDPDLPADTLDGDPVTDPDLPADTLNGDPVTDPDLTADTFDGDLVTDPDLTADTLDGDLVTDPDLPADTLDGDLVTDQDLPADTLDGDLVTDPDLTADTLDGDPVTDQDLMAHTINADHVTYPNLLADTLDDERVSGQDLTADTLDGDPVTSPNLPADTLVDETLTSPNLPADTLDDKPVTGLNPPADTLDSDPVNGPR